MTIEKSVEFLKIMYERLDEGKECVDVSDISVSSMIEAVDIAIELLEDMNQFWKWRKEVYGDDD
jgi:hypothetical protein